MGCCGSTVASRFVCSWDCVPTETDLRNESGSQDGPAEMGHKEKDMGSKVAGVI